MIGQGSESSKVTYYSRYGIETLQDQQTEIHTPAIPEFFSFLSLFVLFPSFRIYSEELEFSNHAEKGTLGLQ